MVLIYEVDEKISKNALLVVYYINISYAKWPIAQGNVK